MLVLVQSKSNSPFLDLRAKKALHRERYIRSPLTFTHINSTQTHIRIMYSHRIRTFIFIRI